jgi:hypothetical protein
MSVDFSGTWTADLTASRLPEPQPTAITITIEHHGPELKQVAAVLRAGGQQRQAILQCRIDGQERRIALDGKPVRGSAKWEGDELMIEIWVELGGRELHLCDYWSLSPDGQILYMEHRNDDLAGQRTVLRRAE